MEEFDSLDDYALDPNDQRFERKFTTDAMSALDLDTMLRVHPSGFVIAYPDRWVNNIYLDTDNLSCYLDHTRGCRSRAKFRIRWYGDLEQERAQPVLEIKRKVGMVGSKLRFKLAEFDSRSGVCDQRLKQLVHAAGIDERIASWVDTMHCVVGNRYRRTYFVTADNEFRMTIDRNLEFFAIPGRAVPMEPSIQDTTIVLELKYQNELDQKVERITQQLPVRMGRMSKYILGIEQLSANGRM